MSDPGSTSSSCPYARKCARTARSRPCPSTVAGGIGEHAQLPGHAAVEAERAQRQALAQVEAQVQIDRQRGALVAPFPLGALLSGDEHVVVELGQARAAHLEMPVVGAQLTAEAELLAVESGGSLARNDEPRIGAVEHAKILRFPFERGAAFGQAQRQRSAQAEAPVAACDRRLDDAQAVPCQLAAQASAGERHAVGRRLDAERVPAQRPRQHRVAERARALQRGAHAARDPRLRQQRLGEQAQLLQVDLRGEAGGGVRCEARGLTLEARGANARGELEGGGDVPSVKRASSVASESSSGTSGGPARARSPPARRTRAGH